MTIGRMRRPSLTTTIHTIAGTGTKGYTGDGGPAKEAQLSEPFMCEFDSNGNLFIAEATNHCIRRVDAKTGTITTVAGTGHAGYTGDGGPAIQATFNEPYALQIDQNGDIYVVDRLNVAIRKIAFSTGIINTIAGGTDTKIFKEPNDCFLDNKGGLLIADVKSQLVTRVDLLNGSVKDIAGNGAKARSGDGGPALEASIMGARALCLDSQGNLYVCEREGNGIRKVSTDGTISTFAGTGDKGYEGDGQLAIQSTWDGPKAIRCDNNDNLIVVDTENHAVRRVNKDTMIVETIAGGQHGHHGDGGIATAAGLDRPHACSIDALGNLYIADSDNHRIRRVQNDV